MKLLSCQPCVHLVWARERRKKKPNERREEQFSICVGFQLNVWLHKYKSIQSLSEGFYYYYFCFFSSEEIWLCWFPPSFLESLIVGDEPTRHRLMNKEMCALELDQNMPKLNWYDRWLDYSFFIVPKNLFSF